MNFEKAFKTCQKTIAKKDQELNTLRQRNKSLERKNKEYSSAIRYRGIRYAISLNPTDILQKIVNAQELGFDTINLFGYDIPVDDLRYKTFLNSLTCQHCGLKGEIMALERNGYRSGIYHFNLYGIEDGKEILMTRDHILPKAYHGSEHIDNMQTLCTRCNGKKSNSIPKEDLSKINKNCYKEDFNMKNYCSIICFCNGEADDILVNFKDSTYELPTRELGEENMLDCINTLASEIGINYMNPILSYITEDKNENIRKYIFIGITDKKEETDEYKWVSGRTLINIVNINEKRELIEHLSERFNKGFCLNGITLL